MTRRRARRGRTTIRVVAATAVALGSVIVASPMASAQGDRALVVTTTTDSRDARPGDGACADPRGRCSLRAAIDEANADPDPTRIRLDGRRTYQLTMVGAGDDANASGDLDLLTEIHLHGDGATIRGRGDRVLDVGAGQVVQLEHVVLTGGTAPAVEGDQSGGGIRNAGNLTITGSTIRRNTATGLAGASGGGILNAGQLAVADSVITRNTALRAGGGIEATATSTTELTSIELTSNATGDAPGNGGGLHVTGAGTSVIDGAHVVGNTAAREGGGLWNGTGSMTVRNTTVRRNTAAGPAADDGGGGLFNDGGVLVIDGSTIVENAATGAAGSGGGIQSIGGTVTARHTRIDDNSAQRAGGGVELAVADGTFDHVTARRNDAGASPGNGGFLHLTGTGSEPIVVRSSTIRRNVAVEGGGLWNSSTGSMTVVRSVIERNDATGPEADQGGGGIYNDGGTLIVQETVLRENTASGTAGSGGGIANIGGNLEVERSSIIANRSNRAGGGIETTGPARVAHSYLGVNDAGTNPGNGGGLHATADVTVTGGVVSANTGTEGGGLWNGASTMVVDGTHVVGNVATGAEATEGGGGLFNLPGGVLDVSGATIESNRATGAAGSGGGILDLGGRVGLRDSLVQGNDARRAGGGIETNGGTVEIDRSTVRHNRTGDAPGNGGGLHITAAGNVAITGTLVTANEASTEGGGLWNSATGTLTVTGSTVVDNTAPEGPDVFTVPGGVTTVG